MRILKEKVTASVKINELGKNLLRVKKAMAVLDKEKKNITNELKALLPLNVKTISKDIIFEYIETLTRGFSADAKKALKRKLSEENFWKVFSPSISELQKIFDDLEICVLSDLQTEGNKLTVKEVKIKK